MTKMWKHILLYHLIQIQNPLSSGMGSLWGCYNDPGSKIGSWFLSVLIWKSQNKASSSRITNPNHDSLESLESIRVWEDININVIHGNGISLK